MSASMTSPERLDGLEKLLLLASLRKEDIAANAEEERKQLQLTNEQRGKVAEAQTYIAKHAGLVAELKGREDVLATEKVKLDLDKKQHAVYVAAENTRLEAFSATLTARENELNETAKKQLAEADRLRGLGIDMSRQHQEAMSVVQRQEANNTVVTVANTNETERLRVLSETLKKKAQLLREQAANF